MLPPMWEFLPFLMKQQHQRSVDAVPAPSAGALLRGPSRGQLAQDLGSSSLMKKLLRTGEADECFTSTSALQGDVLPEWQWKTDTAEQIWSDQSERLKCLKPARESDSSMPLISRPAVSAGVISLAAGWDWRNSADDVVRWGRIKSKPQQLLLLDPVRRCSVQTRPQGSMKCSLILSVNTRGPSRLSH